MRRVGDPGGAALAQGSRARLADRRIRDVAVVDPRAQRPGIGQGPGRRTHPRDLPADRPVAAGLRRSGSALGENTIAVDCDVLQADGGTRTAAVTGRLRGAGRCGDLFAARSARCPIPQPLSCQIAAVSVGVVEGRVRVDLPVRGGQPRRGGHERGGHRHRHPGGDPGHRRRGRHFPRRTLDAMLDAAMAAIGRLTDLQRAALAMPYPKALPHGSAVSYDPAQSPAGHPERQEARRTAAHPR